MSMPGTTISSLTCWMARSASPLTSFSAVNPAGMIVAFARMASAIPSRSISPAKQLLQIRTRALDGTLRLLFERWYPGLSNDNVAGSDQTAAA